MPAIQIVLLAVFLSLLWSYPCPKLLRSKIEIFRLLHHITVAELRTSLAYVDITLQL